MKLISMNSKQEFILTESGLYLDSHKLNRIASGEEGVVYRDNDIAIKIYYPIPRKVVLKKDMIDYLSTISTKRIVLPQEAIMDENSMTRGYKMPFISGGRKKVFLYKKEKLLNELSLLRDDLIKLGNKQVIIGDLRFSNFLSNKKGFYLIDSGDYYRSDVLSNTTKNNVLAFNQFIIDDFIGLKLKQETADYQRIYRYERYKIKSEYVFIGDYLEDKMEKEENLEQYVKRLIKK